MVLGLIALLLSPPLQAHTVRPAVVTMTIGDEGRLDITVKANAEVWLAGISPDYTDTNNAPNAELYDDLRAMSAAELTEEFDAFAAEFTGRLQLRVDDQPVPVAYTSIEVIPEPDPELARESLIFLSAELPTAGELLTWVWPDDYGSNVLRIQRAAKEDVYSVWLKRGAVNDPFPLQEDVVQMSRGEVAWSYLVIGFEHIIPKGLDHILFVVGIFLLSIRLGSLLWQVTAFTLAHTITLGLSIYGVISAPASIVEPLIALSIAYVGIENCLSSKLQPWRIALVFCFGLLHGMGFAGVLTEIGLPRSEFLTALITFNVGVEFGQLAVILLCFLVVGWWRHRDWYRQRIVIPGSLIIAATGLYWTFERVVG